LEPSARLLVGLSRVRRDRRQATHYAAQLARGRRRQPPFERAGRGRSDEAERAHTTGRSETGVTAVRLGTVADADGHVEELTSMADQPVIVEREEAGHAAFRERADDGGGETGEMVNVRDVGLEVVDQPGG